jgi:hypothetical protein
LTGISQLFGEALNGGGYFPGFWKADLGYRLPWSAKDYGIGAKLSSRAPARSWALVDRPTEDSSYPFAASSGCLLTEDINFRHGNPDSRLGWASGGFLKIKENSSPEEL